MVGGGDDRDDENAANVRQAFTYNLVHLGEGFITLGKELNLFIEIVNRLQNELNDPALSDRAARIFAEVSLQSGWLSRQPLKTRLLWKRQLSDIRSLTELTEVILSRAEQLPTVDQERVARYQQESQDPSWIQRALDQLAGQMLSGHITKSNLEQYMSAARDLLAQRYGWQELVQQQGIRQFFDEKGNSYLIFPDGRRVQAWDCFEGSYAVAKVLERYGLSPQLYIGSTSSFARDVYVVVTVGEATFRLSLVPSLNGVETGTHTQWKPDASRVVDLFTAQQMLINRTWQVGLSQLRPLAVSERRADGSRELELGGVALSSRGDVVITHARQIILPDGSVDGSDVMTTRVTVPLRVMRLESGKSVLGEVLNALGESDRRTDLEEALKRVSPAAHIESNGKMSQAGFRFLKAILSIPVIEGEPDVSQLTSRIARIDNLYSTVPGFLQWVWALSGTPTETAVRLSEIQSVIILPDQLLHQMDDAAFLNVLAALPPALADRIYLLGTGWNQFNLQELNPHMHLVSSELRLQMELGKRSGNIQVHILGVEPDDPLVAKLDRLLKHNERPTTVLVTGVLVHGLREFLLELGKALGVPEEAIQEEMDNLVNAFESKPITDSGA